MNWTRTCRAGAVWVAATMAYAAAAQTITVTTLNDVVDFAAPRRVENLPGPDGRVSFREAVTAANNTPGPQTIEFAIPRSEWWLVTTYALLRLESGVFELIDDGTTVDFSTQADATGDTNPTGMEVGIFGLEANGWGTPAIIIYGDDCTIRGLGFVHQRGAAVSIWRGQNNRIVGCVTTGVEIYGLQQATAPHHNVIGGTQPGDGNTLGSVSITCWANDNLVIGNHLSTAAVSGSRYCAYPERNRIGGPTAAERNIINDFGRYGEEGFPIGAGVRVTHARDTLIEGNYIGVTADGMARHAQRGTAGVEVLDAVDTTIRGNLISGIYVIGVNHYAGEVFGDAIRITYSGEDTVGTVIEGNLIGTDATGENPILTHNGVVVGPMFGLYGSHNTRIGSTDPGLGNVIAFTQMRGVSVSTLADSATISGNSIHSNGLLDIDLAAAFNSFDGVTPNDPGDGDTGGNGLQNFPILTSAGSDGSATTIEGTIDSVAGEEFVIEFFAAAECHASGHGGGEVFLGSAVATTDTAGHAAFTATIGSGATGVATATATRLSTGETSEFSACIAIASVAPPCPGDYNGDGVRDTADFFEFFAAFFATPPDADYNGDGGTDTADFFEFFGEFFGPPCV